jgi:hypothetical protein
MEKPKADGVFEFKIEHAANASFPDGVPRITIGPGMEISQEVCSITHNTCTSG